MSPRVWVITGTSSGLGLATALHALRQGDMVIATVRSLSRFPKDLEAGGARPLVLDLCASDNEIRRRAEDAIAVYGHVDILVNNAGTALNGFGPLEELGVPSIREQFQVNLFGQITFTQPFVRHFRLRKSGQIFNVSSMGSVGIFPAWGAYMAAKAALNAFSDALHAELKPYGVRVLTLMPGYFPSNIFKAHPLHRDSTNRGPHESRPEPSQVYTDVSQGYDSLNWIPTRSTAAGHVGDPAKFAAAVYDIATDSGVAEGLSLGKGEKFNCTKIPLGSDSGEIISRTLGGFADSVADLEPLWRSTDMEPEKQALLLQNETKVVRGMQLASMASEFV